MNFSRKEELFIELLQLALWDKQPNIDIFHELTPENWQEVIQYSVVQGVQAIIFDGVLRLPKELHPPRKLKVHWIINIDAIEKRFDRYLNTCAELVKLYAQNNIKMMLLKGIGLAYEYPVPRHREGGDIDIWLFGDYKLGNEVIKRQGIKKEFEDKKHLIFLFQDVPIENHRKFLNEHRYKVDVELEAALNDILKREEPKTVLLPQDTSIFIPSSTFNAIYLIRHMIVHIPSGISVRHLCDWSMFLQKYHGEYDAQYMIDVFEKVGLLELVGILSSICVKYIGLPKSCNPFKEIDSSELESLIFADILGGKIEIIDSSNPFKIMISKWNRFYKSLWKHQLAHNMSKSHAIWEAVCDHLLTPATILKR